MNLGGLPEGSFTSLHLLLPDGGLSFQSGPQEYASTEMGLKTPQGSSEARRPKETAMAVYIGPRFHEASLSCDMSCWPQRSGALLQLTCEI